MAELNSDENPPFEFNNYHLEQSSYNSGTDLVPKNDDFYDSNSNKDQNYNVTDGEPETNLSPKCNRSNEQKDQNYTDKCKVNDSSSQKSANNGPHIEYNDFSRPAGLSSDRCVRDFLSAKYKKYHWNRDKMNVSDSFKSNIDVNGVSNTDSTGLNKDGNHVKEAVKLNYLMRKENRLRNMSHSDIFGANDISTKRSLSHNTDFNSDTNSTASNNDFDISNYNSSKRFKSSGSNSTNSEASYDSFKNYYCRNMPNDSSGIKGDNTNSVSLIVIHLSGLKSNASEKQLINFCDSCKMNVVSINLDRNILTHSCTGTGTIKVRGSKGELAELRELLKQNGYKCQVK